jgi:NitT/TauT family transport system substrate-binding protein
MKSIFLAGILLASSVPAFAEVTEVQVAQQYGVSFLPLMVMEREKLVEKHAMSAGLSGMRVSWAKLAGPSVINDGLISGSVQFAATGAPSLITLWDKTNGAVKAVSAMTTYPLYLVTRNPDVKSIKDFTEKDKIAIPSVKVSTQAIVLQMAAARIWGQDQYARLDSLTIGLSHPDAMLALMSGTSGVNAHFSTSPFYEQEVKIPGVKTITTSYEILGGRASALVITATSRFREANPKTYRAFFEGLAERSRRSARTKRGGGRSIEQAQDRKNTMVDILRVIENPDYAYTLRPEKVFQTALFMNQIGTIKKRPASLRELFFPEAHSLGGD